MIPFSEGAKREIYKRDSGECQSPNCVCQAIYGNRATWKGGFHIQMAHYPELHRSGIDHNPENGRVLDTTCHIIEELERGNKWGAKKLYESQTVRNYNWLAQYGGVDQKLPFEWYEDYALGDEGVRAELVQTAQDLIWGR
jgi:hypothetical protein